MKYTLGILILVLLACGGTSNASELVGTDEASEFIPPTTYTVGEVVAVEDHTITLNSVDTSEGVVANFTVENKGEEITVSSMLNMEAKDSNGSKLDPSLCSGSLNGSVLPGDKLTGDVCWKSGEGQIKLYYKANLFGKGAVVWVAN